jgi:hypothetical protein
MQIDAGSKLIGALVSRNFPMSAAYWLYTGDAGQWYLYLVSEEVERRGINEAYKIVHGTMRRLSDLALDRFEVKLVSPSDPTAKAVTEHLTKHHGRTTSWLRGVSLHGAYFEGAYLYPPPLSTTGTD